jgi:hypothetical protein
MAVAAYAGNLATYSLKDGELIWRKDGLPPLSRVEIVDELIVCNGEADSGLINLAFTSVGTARPFELSGFWLTRSVKLGLIGSKGAQLAVFKSPGVPPSLEIRARSSVISCAASDSVFAACSVGEGIDVWYAGEGWLEGVPPPDYECLAVQCIEYCDSHSGFVAVYGGIYGGEEDAIVNLGADCIEAQMIATIPHGHSYSFCKQGDYLITAKREIYRTQDGVHIGCIV